jgi:two-component system, NarL family, sensor histidine kinase UhpB
MATSSLGVATPAIPGSAARRDLALVVLITIVAAILCVKLNVGEALLSWTRPRERFQLDELPAVLLVFAACLIWFSTRRYHEARNEIGLRRRAEADLYAALAENRRLAQQYVDMQEAERKALARDLHDELGQYLNAIKLDAVSVRDRLESPDPPGYRIAAGMIGSIDRVQSVVMGLMRQLRPVGLDELGLAAAIEHCANEWRRRLPQIAIGLSVSDSLEGLDEMCRLALYRLVQEALTNVARHSHATRVEIRIGRESAGRIVASIEDDGVGTDLTRPGSGLGLVGMRERAEALGGSLTLASVPGSGFTLLARIPIERAT